MFTSNFLRTLYCLQKKKCGASVNVVLQLTRCIIIFLTRWIILLKASTYGYTWSYMFWEPWYYTWYCIPYISTSMSYNRTLRGWSRIDSVFWKAIIFTLGSALQTIFATATLHDRLIDANTIWIQFG